MTPKKNYSRYFIILQEDEKGYSLDSGKIPSGYAKLEMKNSKCKISYYVQNLKKDKQPYYMILICGKKDVNKIIKVGKLNIDDHGRVDIFHEYDMDNIADTGIAAEKIIGAAIVKFLDVNVISIMSGFSTTDKPIDWKSYKVADGNKEKKETRSEDLVNEFDEYEQSIELIKVKSDQENSKIVDKKERVKVEPMEAKENVDEENNAIKLELEDQRHTNESVKVTGEPEEEIEINNTEDIFEVDIDRHKKHKECKEDKKDNECKENKKEKCDNKENNYNKDGYAKGNMGTFFKSVVEDLEEVQDFSKEIKWCTWFKVPVHNLENMYDLSDYNKYTIAYYPMICYFPYIRNHKSFMLGYKCDSSGKMKYIVYGIPGSRSKNHQPYGGKTGFVTWIEGKDNDGMGHWLMFYDFKNSTIVVPVKK
ncbi:DUF7922 domain-containing protein [Clostridium lacusfryxellense]|uniref:DUF7922 domain-containing protein n=1 Tax=Clostridium lacusfryxellense TaxID=205328 RepID=UPI001C0B5E69|nr:hypothetical protein [Clostridium lacusfryxellense]MBU3113114.1 hypothetical protein [Clostridium lacusfryxellense]